MKYQIHWGKRRVRVDYHGDIDIPDIESAHFQMAGDHRFYDCDLMILNIAACSLDRVEVDRLVRVIANDVGAGRTNKHLKVAFITTDPDSIAKATQYISRFTALLSPWHFCIVESEDEALRWFNSQREPDDAQ